MQNKPLNGFDFYQKSNPQPIKINPQSIDSQSSLDNSFSFSGSNRSNKYNSPLSRNSAYDNDSRTSMEDQSFSSGSIQFNDNSRNSRVFHKEPKPQPNDDYKITIDWVRHAESCSNLDSNNYMDKNDYPSRTIGYNAFKNNSRLSVNTASTASILSTNSNTNLNKDFNQKLSKNLFENMKELTSIAKAFSKYHPNLSYIGIQQSILLNMKLRKSPRSYTAVFVSPTVRTIMTAMIALRGLSTKIYVVPFISEHINLAGPFDDQNTALESSLLKRQITFIKKWFEENWISKFDDICIMMTLRKLKNILESTTNTNIHTNNSKDFINQINDIFECKIVPSQPQAKDSEKSSEKCNNLTKIKTLLDKLQKDFSCENEDTDCKKITKIAENLTLMISPSYLRGHPICFSMLENYENIANKENQNNSKYYINQLLRKPDFSKFYTSILPTAVKMNTLTTSSDIKIMCVSHGGVMKKFFSQKYSETEAPKHILNTQIFREIIPTNYIDFTKNGGFHWNHYVPTKIRSNFENFEALNTDICRLESLKGIINYPLYNPDWATKIKPAISFLEKKPLKEYVSNDVQFYFDNIEQYHKPTGINVMGGSNVDFNKKYKKYKKKYDNLVQKN